MSTDSTAPTTIFAVDDDAANLVLLERIFSRRPNTVVVTDTDGARGLERIRESLPQLVFLDLNIGGMGGEAIVREIRSTPSTAAIPVVMISGDVSSATKDLLREAGATHYLEKPLVIGELLGLVDSLLAGAA